MTTTAILAASLAALVAAGLTFLLLQRRIVSLQRQGVTLDTQLQAREQELGQQIARFQALQTDYTRLQESSTQLREQLSALQIELGHERRRFEEHQQALQQSREQMANQFKVLANEILDDKSRKFTASNQENIARILAPLQEKIQHFEKRVEETYDRESKERFSLAKEIKALQELNQRISEDAVNLTNALKGDNKAQGSWGEFVLEKILEKSGLQRGREYEVQVSMRAEDGSRSQPDVVVHLPESRDIVIDSKVSLKAYDAWCAEDDGDRKAEWLRQHVQSLRNHVKLLAGKDYQKLDGVNTLDFVLLFVPVEASFTLAAREDPQLFMEAFEKNIIIVVPSTLLATLRIIQNIWRLAQQDQNAHEIARQAGNLYDKFVAFVADLEDIGLKIEATRKSYDKAHNKLSSGRGNIVTRIENLRQLGARTAKRLDEGLLLASGAEDLEAPDATQVDDESDAGSDKES
jgi:DNA recombination protein RmuC